MSEAKDPTKALESTGITRRGFLKTTGAAALGAGAVAMGGLAPMTKAEATDAAATEGETVFHSACRGNCGSKCHMDVVVREGKVVRVAAAQYPEEDARWRRLCVKGYTQPQRVYDPDRLKYPMRRTGERGEGQWERISWDEAIEEIAGKIGPAIKDHGGTSVGVWSSYGSYGVLNGAQAGYMSMAYGRFITSVGATILGAGADYAQIYEQCSFLDKAAILLTTPLMRSASYRGAAILLKRMCMGGNSCARLAKTVRNSLPSIRSSLQVRRILICISPFVLALMARLCSLWQTIFAKMD